MIFNKKAQGTIEYLVIIGVVVVVALGVVGVVSDIASTSGVADTQTKAYFESQTPFAIIESRAGAVPQSGCTDECAKNREIVLFLKNNSNERLIIKSISVADQKFDVYTCSEEAAEWILLFKNSQDQSTFYSQSYCADNPNLYTEIIVQPFGTVAVMNVYANGSMMNSIFNEFFTDRVVKSYDISIDYETENGLLMTQYFDRKYPLVWEEKESEYFYEYTN
jgi:hypothetical protein